jgi:alanine racemase
VDELRATRPALATVDLEVLAANLAELRRRIAGGVAVIASVKANGYGHGAVEVASTLQDEGVDMLATGSFDEAVAMRAAGVSLPILMLPGALPAGIGELLEHGLTPTVWSLDGARAAARAAAPRAQVWVKVDAGLGRLGVPLEHAPALLRELRSLPELEVEGLYTHLPFADAPGREWATERLAAFRTLCAALAGEGLLPPATQALSSGGILAGLDAGCTAVCPGHALYGLPAASADVVDASGFAPVLRSIATRLIHVASHPAERAAGVGGLAPLPSGAVTGVVPFGRTDGYRAAQDGRQAVMLVRGRRAPVRGVSLEHTTLDLTNVPGAAVGDEVIVLGAQGADAIGATQLADWQGVRPDDVVLAFDGRMPRSYVGGSTCSANDFAMSTRRANQTPSSP